MNKIKYISSVQNSLIKKIVLLKEKSRERKKTGFFVLEGLRELQLALKGNFVLDSLFYDADIISETALNSLLHSIPNTVTIICISKEVYKHIAYRDTTEGVLALVKAKDHSLDTLHFKTKNPLILVAQAPEKPGNIGALLRTADAAHLDAVIIADPKTDLYNPNTIRSSVGCIFTVSIAMASTSEIIDFLKAQHINIYCAALSASEVYTKINYTQATALVVGTESDGLSETWLNTAKKNIIIPMNGEIDSMNVSVSAAILIFEAIRQRGL